MIAARKRERSQRNTKKIVIVGRVPPPPGGVGASILSIVDALRTEPQVWVCRLDWHQIWRIAWILPDVVHYNFSKPMKRFIGGVFAKCVGAHVVHTVHGNDFDFSHWANRLAMFASDGFILVNERIYWEFFERAGNSKSVLMTPILRSADDRETKELDAETARLLDALPNRRIAAVYAHSKDYRNGIETYGLKFVAELLPDLDKMGYSVLFLDTQGKYEYGELDPHHVGNAIHLKRGVDFRALCRQIDVYLRPTATDGNSVAVLEALDENVPVVASNVVPRPEGVVLYEFMCASDFLKAMNLVTDIRQSDHESSPTDKSGLSNASDYLRFLADL